MIRILLTGVLSAALFGGLAILCTDSIPVTLSAGSASSTDSPLGQVRRVQLSVATSTLNELLDVDELTREQWMDFVVQAQSDSMAGGGFEDEYSENLPEAGIDEAASSPEADGLEVPEDWPFEGEFTVWSRPAVAVAAATGWRLSENKISNRMLGTIDPLVVEVPMRPSARLLWILAPLIAGHLVFRGRGARGLRFFARCGAGFLAGVTGLALVVAGSGAAAWYHGIPRLSANWVEYLDQLIAAGRLEAPEYLTRGNLEGFGLAAILFLGSSMVAAVGSPRRHAGERVQG